MKRRWVLLLVLWIVLSMAWLLIIAIGVKQQETEIQNGVAAFRKDAAQKAQEFCHGQAFSRSMNLMVYTDLQLEDTTDGLGLIQPPGPLYVADWFGRTKSWAATTQSAEFQKLSSADREMMRQQYFQDVERPRLFDGQLAQDAKAAFDSVFGAASNGNSASGLSAPANVGSAGQAVRVAGQRNTIEEAYYFFSKCQLARVNMSSANQPIRQKVSIKGAVLATVTSQVVTLLLGLMGSCIVIRKTR